MMSIDLDLQTLLNILLLLGVLQGIIVAFLLLIRKRPRSLANLLLAAWVLALVLSNVRIIIDTEQLYRLWGQRVTLMIPLSFSLLYGPLLYFFIKSLTASDFRFERRYFWYLLPGLLEFIYLLIIYLQPLEYKQWFFGQVHWKWVEPSLEVAAVLSFAFYLVQSSHLLKQYKQLLNEQYATSDMEQYDWLRRLTYVLLALLGLWVVLTFIDVAIMGYRLEYIYFYPYYIAITYLCYFIGYAGYFRPETVILMKTGKKASTKNLLSEDRIKTLQSELENLMAAEKLFLNPQLKAIDVSERMGLSVQQLSYLLNQGLDVSFSEYINGLRIVHVKVQLQSANLERLSLMGIAQGSGFNSESSFYRIFKEHTGQTPNAFVKAQKRY